MSPLRTIRRLLRNRSGVAMVEFALGAPFLLTAGLWGAEIANYALVTMKVGQLATHIADNASRIGDTSTLQNRRIYESDIIDVIVGAQIQSGSALGLYNNGRVTITSLRAEGDATHYIDWQRCRGAKNVASSYGLPYFDGGGFLPNGIGPPGEEVFATPDDALIFVEINYTYQPLISAKFLGSPDIKSIASFMVRDDRDLSQIYQRDPSNPDPEQSCNVFSGNVVIDRDGTIN